MNDPLYRKELLRLAADAHGAGRLPSPDAKGEAFNPACGDRVVAYLAIVEGRITAMAHETRACVLAQASASILGQALVGATRPSVEKLREMVAAMLASGLQVPQQPFDTYAVFNGAVEYHSRHRCVLLPIEAVLQALEASNVREPGSVGTEG